MSRVLEAVDSSSLVHSVSDVAALFRAAVSHGGGTNPAAVRVFRRRPRDPVVSSVLEAVASSSFVHSVSDVSALFQAAVSHGLGTNPAAVRMFRRRCKLLWKLKTVLCPVF